MVKSSIFFAIGMMFIFLSVVFVVGVVLQPQFQFGQDIYTINFNGVSHYSWCNAKTDMPSKNIQDGQITISQANNQNLISVNMQQPIFLSYTSATHSMTPAIPDNSYLFMIRLNSSTNLVVGDIVSARGLAHRIVKIENINGVDYYTTKGDNSQESDEGTITRSQIEYKIIGVIF